MKYYLTSQKYAHCNPNLTADEIDQIDKAYLGKLRTVCSIEVWLPVEIKKPKRYTGAVMRRGGSIIVDIPDLLNWAFFKKAIGVPALMVTSMKPNYPKLVIIKDL